MGGRDFDDIVEQSAVGLKADPELWLDVRQELHSHLEETAEHFRQEGKGEEESAAMARRAFGSPLDVAAELLAANKRRMKLRSLMRITFGALVVPLATFMALYVGYGRMARAQAMAGSLQGMVPSLTSAEPGSFAGDWKLPLPPFFGLSQPSSVSGLPVTRRLRGSYDNAAELRAYWEEHRRNPDGYIYYAYYAGFLEPKDEKSYVQAMRLGEKIEPQNGLYNELLAMFYLKRGMTARSEKGKADAAGTDELLDRRSFELGLAELLKLARKPYLREYRAEIMRKKLASLPEPLLTEDYILRIAIASGELFPSYSNRRALARKIAGSARLLAAGGRQAEAVQVMDAWKPYMKLLAADPDSESVMIGGLVTMACANLLAAEGAEVYDALGERAKAGEGRAVGEALKRAHEEWKGRGGKARNEWEAGVVKHGSRMMANLLPVFGGVQPGTEELTPGRMHEHVLMETIVVQLLLVILTLALWGTLIQGAVWLYRLRQSGSIPLLLMPPARTMARALLTGVLLPLIIYWFYSRLPIIGGREYGWAGGMWPRFVAELLLTSFLILWLPARHLRREVRRRCLELDIPVPERREEGSVNRRFYGGSTAACLLVAAALFIPGDASPWLRTAGVLLSVGLFWAGVRYGGARRLRHGLYYGTLSRTMAASYAFAIILLALTAQPWLLRSEAVWLRKDTLICGALSSSSQQAFSVTSIEARAARQYAAMIRDALEAGAATHQP